MHATQAQRPSFRHQECEGRWFNRNPLSSTLSSSSSSLILLLHHTFMATKKFWFLVKKKTTKRVIIGTATTTKKKNKEEEEEEEARVIITHLGDLVALHMDERTQSCLSATLFFPPSHSLFSEETRQYTKQEYYKTKRKKRKTSGWFDKMLIPSLKGASRYKPNTY